MNNQLKRNRRLILLIFAMSLGSFLMAWIMQQNPQMLSSSTNRGQLILPLITTKRSDLTGFDAFSADNLSELKGRWVLVNVIPKADCNQSCLDALHKTKQLRLMMSKDLTRIRRVVLVVDDVDPVIAATWWQDDPRLLRAKPKHELFVQLSKSIEASLSEGLLFLMDPLGNLMMWYEAGFDPYDVKSDLKKLLSVSQIG